MALPDALSLFGEPSSEEFEHRFAAVYKKELAALDALHAAGTGTGERDNIRCLHRMGARGVAATLARRGEAGRAKGLALAEAFVSDGAKAALLAGSMRGGDFLNNQLRGRWAEQVVLSMDVPGIQIVPFGPSGAAMPGEEDHRQVVTTFREVVLLEGKRADLLCFEESTWKAFSTDDRLAAATWPERRLEAEDENLVRAAACAIEVKNSTWHYGKRREAGGGRLSITVKDEELAEIDDWAARWGVPVVFAQVLFDEVYVMSYARMIAAIARGYVYEASDYELDGTRGAGGKTFHKFLSTDERHFCAEVEFPSASKGVVRVLADGNVVPYIEYAPARSTLRSPEVLRREMAFEPEATPRPPAAA